MGTRFIETLEDRRLFSATIRLAEIDSTPGGAAIHAQKTTYPDVVYSWHVTSSDGTVTVLKITKQSGTKFSGWAENSSGKAPVTGTLSTNGTFKATITHTTSYSKLSGTFSGKKVSGSFREYKTDGTYYKKGTFSGHR